MSLTVVDALGLFHHFRYVECVGYRDVIGGGYWTFLVILQYDGCVGLVHVLESIFPFDFPRGLAVFPGSGL